MALLRAATWKWKVEGMYCLLANGLVDRYMCSFGVANSVTRYGSKYSSVTLPPHSLLQGCHGGAHRSGFGKGLTGVCPVSPARCLALS